MKCFVASAFDQDDVDAIYDEALEPVLRELGVQAVRVNRIEHNDDIDDKIFDLLDSADLCIADLTYARPSVYYEAGYAHAKGRPVIYISRSDHFRARDDDPAGNRRVHFDLQMKNIIAWKEPNKTFKDTVRRRLQYVLKPLLLAQAHREVVTLQQSTFESLSQHQRLIALLHKGKTLLCSRRFKDARRPDYVPKQFGARRFTNGTYQQVCLTALASLTKSDLRRMDHFALPWVTAEEKERITDYQLFLIVAALRSIRRVTLAGLMPHYELLSNGVFRIKLRRKGVAKGTSTIVVVDSIKSVEDFGCRLKEVFTGLGIV